MQLRLDGKTALVTGAGRNLGRAIALALGEAGARVAVNARTSRAEAEAVAEAVRQAGGEALVALADVGNPAAVEEMATSAVQRFGPIDILVNNAAVRPRQALLEITPEDWDRVLRNNLSSAFYCARAVLPSMRRRGFGRIINISGVDGVKGATHRAHNVTAKAGLIGLTKALALEAGHAGITVNAVVPGAFDTSRNAKDYPNWPPPAQWLKQLPVSRLGESGEVAALCLYLASDAAAYITGQAIHINGGLLMP